MRLEAFAQLLKDAGAGQPGRDLFVYFMPDDVTAGILLRTPLQGDVIDHELPGYHPAGQFQMIVRAQDYAAGFALCERAMPVLTLLNAAVGSYHVNYCRPRHEPIVYPRSSGSNLEFAINFDCNYVAPVA